jgi:DMSO/TMAO reductase YedYZ molybdopterin-dependent catalytic subunit
MLRRRELLTGVAASWAARRLWASEAGAESGAETEVLSALPGKQPLIRRAFRPPNYETPLVDLGAPFTRNEAFFVRYHLAVIPEIDTRSWRLEIAGTSVQQPLTLSLEDLKRRFEPVTLAAVNQCSGNRRGLFSPRVPGVQWGDGAMGNARWTGVRLRDVLRQAGVAADALEVWFRGADSAVLPATPNFQKSLPMERALAESTLIAFAMNGAALPHWNGAPARLVVPGWTGTYWMKHLTEIRVEPKPLDNFWMKSAYRLPTGAFPGARFVSQETPETTPITEILVNTLITSHVAGETLHRGRHALFAGKAWDNGAGIERVEISTDGRQSWRDAQLGHDLGRFAWREFTMPLDTSKTGALEVAVRAKSRSGLQQPEKLTFNAAGYHDNIVQSVSLKIA